MRGLVLILVGLSALVASSGREEGEGPSRDDGDDEGKEALRWRFQTS